MRASAPGRMPGSEWALQRVVSRTGAGLLLVGLSALAGAQMPPDALDANLFPPWQQGANNDALNRGVLFTVPQVDVLADFHGDLRDPKLVLFVGGNYFFAMAPLVKEFEKENPEFAGRVFWETLPPGVLDKQMAAGGTITTGNMTFTVHPDAYFAGMQKVKELISNKTLAGPAVPYVTNQLTIMVPQGNPAHVTGLKDLGRPEIRLAMPNPEFEGVARQIQQALKNAGGDELLDTVYRNKVTAGTTVLTQIHHRQTPLFLMQHRADAGVTWQSEALFQESIGNPIAHVDLAPEINVTAIYAGALVTHARHAHAARRWLQFIRSDAAFGIFEHYGFRRYVAPRDAGGDH